MVGRVSVTNAPLLKATIYAIKAAPTEIRKQIRAETRALGAVIAKDEIDQQTGTVQQTRLIKNTVKVAASDQNIRVRAASSKRKGLSGGAVPAIEGVAFEFGSNRNKTATYRRNGHRVKRHTARQMPTRNKSGYIFYPAVAGMVPRILALWTQTTVRVIGDALDGKK